ncbi:MAG: hypothetical protein OXH50_05235, partial [Gemmatimonadetes bacterium]|nr:hypothetical protein [Gemmatimonadota bacterium]
NIKTVPSLAPSCQGTERLLRKFSLTIYFIKKVHTFEQQFLEIRGTLIDVGNPAEGKADLPQLPENREKLSHGKDSLSDSLRVCDRMGVDSFPRVAVYWTL